MRCAVAACALATLVGPTLAAQTPQPFPRAPQPAQTQPARPAGPGAPPTLRPPATAPTPAQPASTPPAAQAPAPAANPVAAEPTAQSLGLPVYPAAQYLATYDAGRGQKYVLYGTTAAFAEIVAYYKTQLRDGGDQVFREPPTHMFDVGRFREETMAFPPGVTVKDFSWGGSKGYPNPKPNGQPARFPTIIMLVPQPPAPAPGARQ